MNLIAIEKLSTGILGLDTILKGGLRQNAHILVSGVPGTGKSIFGLQFVLEGARKGEAGLFITCEEELDAIRIYARELGLDLEKYEKKGLLHLIKQEISDKKLVSIATPLETIRKYKIKRAVLDSLSLFRYIHAAGEMDFRKEVLSFLATMKQLGITLLVTAEKETHDIDRFKYASEDFLFEGLIILTKIRKGSSFERVLHVAKMRGQDHALDIYPFVIKQGGIEVLQDQLPFSLLEQDVSRGKP